MQGVFTATATNTPSSLEFNATTGVLTWTSSTGADGYKVELQAAYISGTQVLLTPDVVAGNKQTANFRSAPNATNCCVKGEIYRARVKATSSGADLTPWSEFLEFLYTGPNDHPDGNTEPEPLDLSWGEESGVPLPAYFSSTNVMGYKAVSKSIAANISCKVGASAAHDCPAGSLFTITPSSCGNVTFTATITVSTTSTRQESIEGTARKPCPAATETQYWINQTPTAPPATAVPTNPPPADTPVPPPATSTRPFVPPPPPVDSGDSGRSSSSDSSSSRSQRQLDPRPTRDRSRLPVPTQDHSRLPSGAQVISESPWIQFREVTGAGIGQQWVIDAGARAAIDLWGPLGLRAEVCFEGMGSMILLDAAYSPRLRVPLTSYLRDGKTCAEVDRAGTVVLMPGMPSLMPTPSPSPSPVPAPTRNPYLIADSLNTMRTLSGCMVRTIELLNFRASPAGQRLGWYSGTSVALARTANWYKVSYMGQEGWVSAHFVTTSGDCR